MTIKSLNALLNNSDFSDQFLTISNDNLSGSFVWTVQLLIHPYAAALSNAFVNGGHLLVIKIVDLVTKQQLLLTKNDVGGFVRAIGFCYLARVINHYAFYDSFWLDGKYQE